MVVVERPVRPRRDERRPAVAPDVVEEQERLDARAAAVVVPHGAEIALQARHGLRRQLVRELQGRRGRAHPGARPEVAVERRRQRRGRRPRAERGLVREVRDQNARRARGQRRARDGGGDRREGVRREAPVADAREAVAGERRREIFAAPSGRETVGRRRRRGAAPVSMVEVEDRRLERRRRDAGRRERLGRARREVPAAREGDAERVPGDAASERRGDVRGDGRRAREERVAVGRAALREGALDVLPEDEGVRVVRREPGRLLDAPAFQTRRRRRLARQRGASEA